VALIASGRIDLKPLITDRYAFEDSVAAFDFAKALPPSSVKVQIEMPR
jgi:D-xylulose reductase